MFNLRSFDFAIAIPASKSLTYYWNLGSTIGILVAIQIATGLLLTLSYDTLSPFSAIALSIIVEQEGG
jgi:quinol-cytochrome oxidoreductase complex cytochrome b subunit